MKPNAFLDFLNSELFRLHYEYESLFWDSYMGNKKIGKAKDRALSNLDAFRGSRTHKATAEALMIKAKGKSLERLRTWVRFFNQYQIPESAIDIRKKIITLETHIQQKRANTLEGYIDPVTKKFVPASTLKMMTMITTHPNELVRKECFLARERLAVTTLPEYVTLVALRNEFARLLGYSDFYDYKLRHIDNMTKKELFGIFGEIANAAALDLAEIRTLEETRPGLRKPWNFTNFLTGDFTIQEDQYYPFTEALPRWLETFSKLGITFADGRMTLDLVERKGKYNNGFCHWPELVHYENNKRVPGAANFTCNVVPGQIGSGELAYKTLFHEGGHAAHFFNTKERDVCLNHEYAPMTAAWAETQSMFIDTIFSSYEWKGRYAKNEKGQVYPIELFSKRVKATSPLRTRDIMSIIMVADFERQVYELEKPNAKDILSIAKSVYRSSFDHSIDSVRVLCTPHLYSWESACSYHGYGLAKVALYQWREYFYKKYGFIVDNPKVGREMQDAWAWGAKYDFMTSIKKVTGKKLSAKAIIKQLTKSPKATINETKRLLNKKHPTLKNTDNGPAIKLVHGKKIIADSSQGIRVMSHTYKDWYETLLQSK